MRPERKEGQLETQKESTKERVFRVAMELFAQNGFHATGVEEISEKAKIGRGGLYYHIGKKERILFEIYEKHFLKLLDEGGNIMKRPGIRAEEKLRLLSLDLLENICAYRAGWVVFNREVHSLTGEYRERILTLRDSYERLWLDVLREGMRRGEFRQLDEMVVKAMLGCHNHAVIWIDPEGRLSPKEISELFCEVMLAGVLSKSPDSGGRP
jgi:AcrR family transcriptional regulator